MSSLVTQARAQTLAQYAAPSATDASAEVMAAAAAATATARSAEFANPKHDFPQRIHYELDDSGVLHASVSGAMNGKETSMSWTWKRRT